MRFPPLTKLYIDKIRNLSNITINFNPELNIIVGPNGVGKSTILNIVKNLFTGEFYTIHSINNNKAFILICEFREIVLNPETLNYFSMPTTFIKYKGTLETNYFTQVINLAKTLSSDIRNNVITQPSKYEVSNVSNLINKNFRIISPVIKSDIPSEDDPTATKPGFIIIDNELYVINELNRQKILEFFKTNKILYFNLGDLNINGHEPFIATYLNELQRKKVVKEEFAIFRDKATKTLNKIFDSKDQQVKYTSLPQMQTEFFSHDGKNIRELSSGEQQLEKLKIFSKAKSEIEPFYVLLDEPEIHLNYGQLSFLSDLITNLKRNNCQVFIATHAIYFIRTSTNQYLVYLRYNDKHFPTQVNLLNAPLKKNLLQYPDLFFAEKIVIVESSADAVFYQRTFDIIFKEKKNISISSKNIQFIPVGGKSQIKNFVKFIQKYLGISYIIITDLDFCLDESTYNFVSEESLIKIRKLLPKVIKIDRKKTLRRFKELNNNSADNFINLIDRIMDSRKVSDNDMKEYLKYKKETEAFSYEPSIIDKMKKDNIFNIFKSEKVWILENFKLEHMVIDELKENGKVSIDKLNELFYPENIKHLQDFIPKKSLKELFELSNYIEGKLVSE